MRFVARAHPVFALFGRFLSASNCDSPAYRCSDLRFCCAASSTGARCTPPERLSLQRTSKNVHEPRPRRRACNETQKMCRRRLAPSPAAARGGCGRRTPVGGVGTPAHNPRAPAGDGRPRGAGGAPGERRRKAVSCTFFSVCCTIADRFGPFRDRSGRLQRLPFYKPFHHHSPELRFSSERPETGSLARARSCNKPQKMCSHPRRRTASAPRPEGVRRANLREDAGRDAGVLAREFAGAFRLNATATRGQPHETCTNRRCSAAAATRAPATGATHPRPVRHGDLWRFRKANTQVAEPLTGRADGHIYPSALDRRFSTGRKCFRLHRCALSPAPPPAAAHTSCSWVAGAPASHAGAGRVHALVPVARCAFEAAPVASPPPRPAPSAGDRAAVFILRTGKNFNLWRRKLKILPHSAVPSAVSGALGEPFSKKPQVRNYVPSDHVLSRAA